MGGAVFPPCWLFGLRCPSTRAYRRLGGPGLGGSPGELAQMNCPQHFCRQCLSPQWAPTAPASPRRPSKTSRKVWPRLLERHCFGPGSWCTRDIVLPSKSGDAVYPSPAELLHSSTRGFHNQMLWACRLLMPEPKAKESDIGLRILTLVGDLLLYISSPVCGSPTQGVMGFHSITHAPLLPFCWVSSLHLWIRISFLVGSSVFVFVFVFISGGSAMGWDFGVLMSGSELTFLLFCHRHDESTLNYWFFLNQCHINRHNSTPSQWW